jgi:hypothetical protein
VNGLAVILDDLRNSQHRLSLNRPTLQGFATPQALSVQLLPGVPLAKNKGTIKSLIQPTLIM